jgi:hypothetical protein
MNKVNQLLIIAVLVVLFVRLVDTKCYHGLRFRGQCICYNGFEGGQCEIDVRPILKLELEKLLNEKQKIDKLLIEFLKKFV